MTKNVTPLKLSNNQKNEYVYQKIIKNLIERQL